MSSDFLTPSSNFSADRRVVSIYHTPSSLLSCVNTHSLVSEAAMCLMILLSHLVSVSVEKHPSCNISSRSCTSLCTGGKRCFQQAWLDPFAQLSRICNAARVDNWRTAKSNRVSKCQHYSTVSAIHPANSSPKERGVLAAVLGTQAQHHTGCKEVIPHAVTASHTS